MKKYRALKQNIFEFESYKLIPIRFEDRLQIMKWRNEQMFHLRQAEVLTEEKQNQYFENVIANLFNEAKPKQLLFSFLKNDVLIGYGGLVHINWIDKNAEISFLIDTEFLNDIQIHCFFFEKYITLIEKVGFDILEFNKLHAEVYDLRKFHSDKIEELGYIKEGILRNQILFNGIFIDSLLFGKLISEYNQI